MNNQDKSVKKWLENHGKGNNMNDEKYNKFKLDHKPKYNDTVNDTAKEDPKKTIVKTRYEAHINSRNIIIKRKESYEKKGEDFISKLQGLIDKSIKTETQLQTLPTDVENKTEVYGNDFVLEDSLLDLLEKFDDSKNIEHIGDKTSIDDTIDALSNNKSNISKRTLMSSIENNNKYKDLKDEQKKKIKERVDKIKYSRQDLLDTLKENLNIQLKEKYPESLEDKNIIDKISEIKTHINSDYWLPPKLKKITDKINHNLDSLLKKTNDKTLTTGDIKKLNTNLSDATKTASDINFKKLYQIRTHSTRRDTGNVYCNML